MSEKESAEYAFMATLDDAGLVITDSEGGGTRYSAFTRDEVIGTVGDHIRRCADMFAEAIAEDLFGDEEERDEESRG